MAGRSTEVASAFKAVAVDYSGGDVTLPAGVRALYCGVAGDIKVDFVLQGTAIVMGAAAAGIEHPWQVSKVYQTGTTATGIVALY